VITQMLDAVALFERYLDLALRGRRRGLVRCIFHRDARASLSLDVDRKLFHCFGCGVKGGVRRFAELVGEARPASVGPKRWRSAFDEARRRMLEHERDAQRRRDRFRPLMDASAHFRVVMLDVDAARRVATAAGPDSELVWELLEIAATLERGAHADLDGAAT
jgi:hypothetical protein